MGSTNMAVAARPRVLLLQYSAQMYPTTMGVTKVSTAKTMKTPRGPPEVWTGAVGQGVDSMAPGQVCPAECPQAVHSMC